MKPYTHLSISERETIRSYLDQQKSIRFIAYQLHRNPSTISREVQRNINRKKYFAHSAQRLALRRMCLPRRRRKVQPGTWLWDEVVRLLHLRWSPDQIAEHLRQTYPWDMTKQISHEAIYQAIYVLPRGELRWELTQCLRQSHRLRRKRRHLRDDRRGQIPDMISIHERPEEIETRTMPGHWEGDLVVGKGRTSAIGTLVERTSRKILICKLHGRSSLDVVAAFENRLKALPPSLRSTLTYDRGSEMSHHKQLTERIDMKVFFCDPQSPWQRGSNENTNGLVRQFFPKGTNFNEVTEKELLYVEKLLNERPRKKLGYRTPDEVFSDHISVALGS
jgi:IS30 family transposase